MADSAQRLQELLRKLSVMEFRLTPQRMAVLRILAEEPEHPTVERIYSQVQQEFPNASLGTVYKTLALLKELGEVEEVNFRGDTFDGSLRTGLPHLICTSCRTVIDLEEVPIEDLALQVANSTGFEIAFHRLDFFGLCPECLKKRQ